MLLFRRCRLGWSGLVRRMRLMAVFLSVAMARAVVVVGSWWRSSSKVTSRTQWRRFSIPQWPWIQAAT